MDMRFHWLRDRVLQGQFIIYWRLDTKNKGGYYKNHHSAARHRVVKYQYLQSTLDESKYVNVLSPQVLRDYANLALYISTRPKTQNH